MEKGRIRCTIFTIIPTYRRVDSIVRTIKSVLNSSYPSSILIVDDSGNKDFGAKLEKVIFSTFGRGEVNIIHNEKNLGFAGSVNRGIQYALSKDAKFIFLLNDDSFVERNCVKFLVSELERRKNCLIAGPTIFYTKSPNKVWSAGGYIFPFLAKINIPLKNKEILLDKLKDMDSMEVDFITGCAFMMKRESLEKIGFFDENNFFFYSEDLDYCLRVKRKGYCVLYVPSAFVWHDININEMRTDEFTMYHLAKSSMILRKKHLSKHGFLLYLFAHTFIYTPYRIYQIARGSRNIKAILSWFKGSYEAIKKDNKNT